jgi:hypothetical protein
LCDRWSLFHDHDQDVTLGLQAHVLEQTGGKQRANCGDTFFRIEAVADPQRQIGKDRSRLGPLRAFDPDVPDDELLRKCRISGGGENSSDEPPQAPAWARAQLHRQREKRLGTQRMFREAAGLNRCRAPAP